MMLVPGTMSSRLEIGYKETCSQQNHKTGAGLVKTFTHQGHEGRMFGNCMNAVKIRQLKRPGAYGLRKLFRGCQPAWEVAADVWRPLCQPS